MKSLTVITRPVAGSVQRPGPRGRAHGPKLRFGAAHDGDASREAGAQRRQEEHQPLAGKGRRRRFGTGQAHVCHASTRRSAACSRRCRCSMLWGQLRDDFRVSGEGQGRRWFEAVTGTSPRPRAADRELACDPAVRGIRTSLSCREPSSTRRLEPGDQKGPAEATSQQDTGRGSPRAHQEPL